MGKLSAHADRYPRAALFVSADYMSLHAEACLQDLDSSLEASKALLEPTAVARRISSIPDVTFGNMLGTPESREMASISPVEEMEPTDSMLAAGTVSKEVAHSLPSRSGTRMGDAEVRRPWTHLCQSRY